MTTTMPYSKPEVSLTELYGGEKRQRVEKRWRSGYVLQEVRQWCKAATKTTTMDLKQRQQCELKCDEESLGCEGVQFSHDRHARF